MAEKLKQATKDSDVKELWEIFKKVHDRCYAEVEEEKRRFELFATNVKRIVEHNEKYSRGEVTFSMGINNFSDKTPDEIPGGVRK